MALDLARLLHQAGHEIIMAETNKAHLSRYSRAVSKSVVVPPPIQGSRFFAEGIIQTIKNDRIDLVIPTCEEVFALAAHHHELSRHCDLFCEPLSELRPLHSKLAFVRLLQQYRLPAPETLLVQSKKDLRSLFQKWDQVVIKPEYSRFARGVTIARSPEEIPELPEDVNWVAQEFISGRRICFYGVAHKGELLTHVLYPVEHCLGDIGSAIAFRSIHHDQAANYARDFIKKSNYTGQISFDLIEQENGTIIAIECNPRATSGLHLYRPEDQIGKAILDRLPSNSPNEGRKAQYTLPLIALSLFRLGPRQLISLLKGGREVTLGYRDILPGIASLGLIPYYAWQAWRKGMGITEASTYDIEWNGSSCE